MSPFATTAEIVDLYRTALGTDKRSQQVLKQFEDRLHSAPAAAVAEAAVYDFLNYRYLEPVPFEHPAFGGPDFECRYANVRFAVEVTALGDLAVTRTSGLIDEPQVDFLNLQGFVKLLRSRFSDKSRSPQARAYSGPRALFISARHFAANALFPYGIESFVRNVMIPRQSQKSETVRPSSKADEQLLEGFRRAYALIVFVHIGEGDCLMAGAIQHEPEYPLGIEVFHNLPFVRLRSQPNTGGSDLEWVIYEPQPFIHRFLPLAMRRVNRQSP